VKGISPDCAIERSIDDLLNRSDIIDNIENILKSLDKDKSYAIGVCGKWGSGKTSLLNLLEEKISKDNTFKIIHFNPWYYSDQKELIQQFFSTLLSEFKPNNTKIKKCAKTFDKGLICVEPFLGDKTLFKLIKKYSEILADSTKENESLYKVKKEISDKLEKLDNRVIVIIDDIDRLDPDEIKLIIKLVRSVADFSNVTYILSYDEDIVSKALDCEIYKGHDYLQKIIQLPIRLPEINKEVLYFTLNKSFFELIDQKPDSDKRSKAILKNCIYPYIQTIRDVNLLINRFKIKYYISKGNTFAYDLLALTLVEMKYPELFNWISYYRYELCKNPQPNYLSDNKEEPKDMYKEYKNAKMDPEYQVFMSTLFPLFDKSLFTYESGLVDEYSISVSKYINNYFILTPSSLILSSQELCNLVYEADHNAIINKIIEFNKKNKFNFLIMEIEPKLLSANKERKELYAKILLYNDDIVTNEYVELISEEMIGYHDILEITLKDMPGDDRISFFLENTSKNNIYSLCEIVVISTIFGCFIKNSEKEKYPTPEEKISLIEHELIERLKNNVVYDSNIFHNSKIYGMLFFVSDKYPNIAKELLNEYIKDENDIETYLNNIPYKNITFIQLLNDTWLQDENIKSIIEMKKTKKPTLFF